MEVLSCKFSVVSGAKANAHCWIADRRTSYLILKTQDLELEKDSRYQGSDIRWLERREEKRSERV